jgi:peptidyl-dipeptidase A
MTRIARHVAIAAWLGLAASCATAPPPEPTAPAGGCPSSASPSPAADTAAAAAPTAQEAQAFVAQTDRELRALLLQRDRTQWVQMTYINDDTDALSSSGEEAAMEYIGRRIRQARRFEGLALPEETARQLMLLRLAGSAPAPSDPKERAELAALLTSMTSLYGKGKHCPKRLGGTKTPCLSLHELSDVMAKSRTYDELLDAWEGWHAIARPIRAQFERYVALGNQGAREIGFEDMGQQWRYGYDMAPADFEAEVERLWQAVKPLYDELHCFVRARLRKHYGAERVPERGPIPAHLLGNMWAQEWGHVFDLVAPFPKEPSFDVGKKLVAKKVDAVQMVKLGERFFTSLGLPALPPSFWERSLFTKPRDRDVVCHASAWDVGSMNDLRIKMCIKPTEEDLVTIHHELGHVYYYSQYYTLPILFQAGANDGFHEGIGDTLALSVTPRYLKELGLADAEASNERARVNLLMKEALEKVAFLPFGLLIDKWRWDVFAGRIAPDRYNAAWWELRRRYQGVAPAVARSDKDFDPGAKYHVPANTPYTRYFLARILQFQFHRALCKAAGHTGPLDACSIYGNRAAGEKLRAMLRLGASKPWPAALEVLSGERGMDPSAMAEYFAPLRAYLQEQNKGLACGWN